MTEAIVERSAIGGDFRSLHQEIAVVVAHHPHVAECDSAIAHRCIVARRHANARAVIAVAGIPELQVLQRDVIGFDLKHGSRMRQHSINDLVRRIENWPGASNSTNHNRFSRRSRNRPPFHLVVGRRVDFDDVACCQRRQRADGMI
jgi:hypothetical protein